MHVYAVALEKGGCGKTALAVNLAAAFQHLGLGVLLIDLDSQASASHWLGVDTEKLAPNESVLGRGHFIIPGKSYAKGQLRARNSAKSRSKALGRSRGAFARASAALVRMT